MATILVRIGPETSLVPAVLERPGGASVSGWSGRRESNPPRLGSRPSGPPWTISLMQSAFWRERLCRRATSGAARRERQDGAALPEYDVVATPSPERRSVLRVRIERTSPRLQGGAFTRLASGAVCTVTQVAGPAQQQQEPFRRSRALRSTPCGFRSRLASLKGWRPHQKSNGACLVSRDWWPLAARLVRVPTTLFRAAPPDIPSRGSRIGGGPRSSPATPSRAARSAGADEWSRTTFIPDYETGALPQELHRQVSRARRPEAPREEPRPSGSPLDVSRDRLSSPGRAKLRGDRTLPHEVLLIVEHSFSFAPAGVGPAPTRFKPGLATYNAIETKLLQGKESNPR